MYSLFSKELVPVWRALKVVTRFAFHVLPLFFFFFTRFRPIFYYSFTVAATVHEQQPQSLTFFTFQNKFYYSWTHKFHFSATFSLKMGPMVLFTHLKITLLQYFSVFSFSFNFQFSAISKQTLNHYSHVNNAE